MHGRVITTGVEFEFLTHHLWRIWIPEHWLISTLEDVSFVNPIAVSIWLWYLSNLPKIHWNLWPLGFDGVSWFLLRMTQLSALWSRLIWKYFDRNTLPKHNTTVGTREHTDKQDISVQNGIPITYLWLRGSRTEIVSPYVDNIHSCLNR